MKQIINHTISLSIISLTLLPFISSAQLINPLDSTDISSFISKILSYVVKIGGVIATFAFIYTGYLFAFARGNTGKLDAAKSALINTVIGVTILLGAQLIGNMITDTIKNIK